MIGIVIEREGGGGGGSRESFVLGDEMTQIEIGKMIAVLWWSR